MRIALLSLLFWALGLASLGQTFPLAQAPPTAEEVLTFLSGMGLSPEFTAAFSSALSAAFRSGRATTVVTLLLLQDLAKLPAERAEGVLEIIRYALAQGVIVDTGLAGSSMMNEARKFLALGRGCEEMERVLGLRLGLLLATRSALLRYGLIQLGPIGPETPVTPTDRLILEVAWAVGDFLLWEGGNPADPRFLGYVRERLNRLGAVGVLAAEESGRIVAALTLEILQEIARIAFQPERR